jgi:hypothetical protein
MWGWCLKVLKHDIHYLHLHVTQLGGLTSLHIYGLRSPETTDDLLTSCPFRCQACKYYAADMHTG